jgi:hypothetical protein
VDRRQFWKTSFLFNTFFSSSCRVSRNVPLLCQFVVYFQYGKGLDLHALASKRSSISAFNAHPTFHRRHRTGKLLLLLRARGRILFSVVLSLILLTLAAMHPARLTASISTFTILSTFNLFVCPSVRQHETTRLPLGEFS